MNIRLDYNNMMEEIRDALEKGEFKAYKKWD